MTSATCVWDGGSPLSGEHVVPRWLRDVLADAFGTRSGCDIGFEFVTSTGQARAGRYSAPKPEIVVNHACESCNTSWMAGLEAATQLILEPLARGQVSRLEVSEQATLARWAAKSVVMWGRSRHHWHPRRRRRGLEAHPPRRHRSAELPRQVGVPQGSAQPADGRLYASGHHATVAPTRPDSAAEPNCFALTLGLGHVVIAVVGGPGVADPGRWGAREWFPPHDLATHSRRDHLATAAPDHPRSPGSDGFTSPSGLRSSIRTFRVPRGSGNWTRDTAASCVGAQSQRSMERSLWIHLTPVTMMTGSEIARAERGKDARIICTRNRTNARADRSAAKRRCGSLAVGRLIDTDDVIDA